MPHGPESAQPRSSPGVGPAPVGDGCARAWRAAAHLGSGPGPASGSAGAETPRALLARLFELEPEAWMRRVPGRETFPWPGDRTRVVKRYVSDAPREWWYERLHGTDPRSPARREAENLAALAALGLTVPTPLAWVEEAGVRRHPRWGGRAARSALVMSCVPHRTTLRARLESEGEAGGVVAARRFGPELLELLTTLHDAGWYHRDLYLEHVGLTSEPQGERLVLFDLGRARRAAAPRRRWFVKDLAALEHSTRHCLPARTRLRFLLDYLRRRGVPRERRRTWLAAVRRKAARLAAHAPRHVDVPRDGAALSREAVLS